MIRHRRTIGLKTGLVRHAHACAAVLAGVLLLLLLLGAAQAQQTLEGPAAEEQVNPPATQAPDSGFRPGFLDAVGRWLGNSKETFDSQLKDTQDRLGALGSQATGAAKGVAGAAEAAGSAVGLPANRVVSGRQMCEVAPNGGADCRLAADALCRTKGFEAGRGLDVTSSRRCPTRAWISGRISDSDCRTETFVTRAVCQ